MAIGRSANIFGQVPGTLTTTLPGEHPASATLKPPAPFHGEASYLENSSTSHSWTGDLSVSLPGLDLPLTGRQFRTSLCVVSPLKAPAGCDFLKPKFAGSARLNIPSAGRQGESPGNCTRRHPRQLAPDAALGARRSPPLHHRSRIHDPGFASGHPRYRITVNAGNRRWVGLMVHKGGMRTEYRARQASYGKYGTIARFPGFGEIRFRFMANGRSHHVSPAPWCEGPDDQLLKGRVVGRIRFVGEEKYTSVSVRRAKAEVETWPRMRCLDREPGGRRRARRLTATFYAFNNARPNLIFSFKRYSKRFRPASRQVEFGVYTASIGNGVAIYRSVRVTADKSTVVVPDPKGSPENVLFRPPPPFRGTASFQRDPESVFTWEGDLSVQFPGVEPLLLTGPTFSTEFCARSGCAHQEVAE